MCVNYGIDSAYREDEHEEKTGVSVRGLCGGCPVFRVPGEIAYVSDHVNVEGGDTVRADEDDGSAEHDVLLYVLYK